MSDRECRDLLRKEQKTPKKDKTTPKKNSKQEVQDAAPNNEEDKENQNNNKTSSKKLFPAENFSHPVYGQISLKNGFLNRQDLSTLKRICKEENLDSCGKKDLITKRLKQYYKHKMLVEAGIIDSVKRGFDYLLVMDFEATCEDKRSDDFPHEIIEFPAVLVNVLSCKIVAEWRRYVRPVINPVLSDFCVSLTGIQQEIVDKAEEMPAVLDQFQAWLAEHKLGTEHTFGLVTDGPFDVGRFLRLSCAQYSTPVPNWASRWINVRKAFANFYRPSRQSAPGLQQMLTRLDLSFQGNPHSGLDDARNIARVVERLLKDGATLRVNERLEKQGCERKDRRLPQVAPIPNREAEDWLLSCKKNITSNKKPSSQSILRLGDYRLTSKTWPCVSGTLFKVTLYKVPEKHSHI